MKFKNQKLGSSVSINFDIINSKTIAELKDALYKNRILVFKNQELSESQFCKLAHDFGTPVPYLQSNYNHPEYPLIFVSSNIKQENEKKIGVARTGGYWHSDTAFEKDPKVITMLMPKVLPSEIPRTTRFIDMSKVYEKLPQRIIREIENANFIHSGKFRYKVKEEDIGLDITEILEMIDYYQAPVIHPAILKHPHTGEKIIYGSRGFTIGIENRSTDESSEILNELFNFAERDEFVREIRWEIGDVIIWDNRYLCHSSGRAKAPTENIHTEVKIEEETMMYRITLKDGLPLSL